uniref:G-protein coupled receptors family 1 profile domain-containing protein n=1 Tax=Mustela putorius furo TaxID=9669 RepID=M3Y367_MUSPF
MLFELFLSIYLVTFTGNLLIILAICSDTHLHRPLYLFLSNLSFTDICFTSTTIPKICKGMSITHSKAMTYKRCFSQIVFGILNNLVLTTMAYDHSVAICHSLHYSVIINQFCGLLALGSYCISIRSSLLETLTLLRLFFRQTWKFHTLFFFFCDLPQVLNLACSDTFMKVYSATDLLAMIPFHAIPLSSYQIVSPILSISSTVGKYKPFSICGSHLSVVSLFYGTGLGDLNSAATSFIRMSLVASVMYTIVTPM